MAEGDEVTFGAHVARLRRRKGWYQRDLAAEVGRTEDWVSAVERDAIPVQKVEILARLALVLGTALEDLLAHPQPAVALSGSPRRKVASARLTPSRATEEDDDEVRRRELLTAATAAVFTPIVGTPLGSGSTPLARLEDLVLYGAAGVPGPREPTIDSVRASISRGRQLFLGARYDALAQSLPEWIGAAQSVGSPEESARAVAALYNIAARLCIKIGDNALVAVTADRAMTAARLGGDGLVTAESQRMVSSAWRRQGNFGKATDIVVRAAHELQSDESIDEMRRLAARAELFATAAYTAAKLGDRTYAHALIAEAADCAAAAEACGRADAVQGVVLHRLSVHYELGDCGQALELARTISPAALPTAERQARFFTDVARAFDQWGKPEQAFRALLAAEQAAPQEIRRGSIRDVVTNLLRHDRSLPGVRALASRAGVQLA